MTRADEFNLAVRKVSAFGDADIFPSPLERFVCQDASESLIAILEDIDRTFVE